MSWLALMVVIASVFVMTASALGGVGDPPSADLPRCDKTMRPCTDPIVLAEASQLVGHVEIVGFNSAFGLCLAVDATKKQGGTSATTSCGGDGVPSDGKAISLGLYGGVPTQIAGRTRGDVTRVRLLYRRKGRDARSRPLFGRVRGSLLSRLELSEPFGVYTGALKGCVQAKSIKAIAYGRSNRRLGQARYSIRGNSCR